MSPITWEEFETQGISSSHTKENFTFLAEP